MAEQTELTVRRSVTVQAPPERAFEAFTAGIGRWWPLADYRIGAVAATDAVIEPREGGRWFERGEDGSECDWGRVLVWEPPDRVVFTWQINGSWQFDPDPRCASEIEARFTASGPEQSVVEVEHRYFERLDGGQAIRDAITSGGGWALLLDGYAKTVAEQG